MKLPARKRRPTKKSVQRITRLRENKLKVSLIVIAIGVLLPLLIGSLVGGMAFLRGSGPVLFLFPLLNTIPFLYILGIYFLRVCAPLKRGRNTPPPPHPIVLLSEFWAVVTAITVLSLTVNISVWYGVYAALPGSPSNSIAYATQPVIGLLVAYAAALVGHVIGKVWVAGSFS